MSRLNELSFREKSVFASLLAVLFVYGGYFVDLFTGMVPPSLGAMLATSIGLVFALVIIEVVLHIAISLYDVKDADAAADERDLLISGRAARISQIVLSFGVILVIGRIVIRGAMDEASGVMEVTLFEVANLLLFFFVLSESVNYAAKLFYYRRGV
jgi:uncharacterized membrane protein